MKGGVLLGALGHESNGAHEDEDEAIHLTRDSRCVLNGAVEDHHWAAPA